MPSPATILSPAEIASTLDQLTDAVIVFDSEWRLDYLNEAARAGLELHTRLAGHPLAGRPAEEFIGKHAWATFPCLNASPFRALYEEAAESGQPKQLVDHFEQVDRWFEARAVPLDDDKLVVIYRDVTEEQRTQREMRELVGSMAEAEGIVHFGIWRWDIGSGRMRWSDELHHIHGLGPGEFEGTIDAFVERIDAGDRERVQEAIFAALEGEQPLALEARIVHADGRPRTVLLQGRAVLGADAKAQGMLGICQDVTQRAQAERALGTSEERMRAVVDNSPSVIVVSDREDRVVLCNAEASRVFGVAPETAIGRATNELLPPEFARARRTARLRAVAGDEPAVSEFVAPQHGEPRCFVSATFPLPGPEGAAAELCTIATDVTERQEKESERRERVQLADQIAAAIEEERLLAYAQPIVDLATGETHASELLVRMRTEGPRPTMLGPDAFLPSAERLELVQTIDTWMVRRALALETTDRLHVNVSAVTMSDPVARMAIIELLRAAPEAAGRLTFEITETADLERLSAAQEFARAVAELGSQLALDDFGVGFGALQYLRLLPFSQIKIDHSFVRGVVASPEDRRVVDAVLSIARGFGVKTVAEGIADAETLDRLREMGVDLGQGYLFGRPSPLLPGESP